MVYSSLWRRAAAAIIDGIILSAISGLCIRIIFLIPFAFIIHFFYKPIFEASIARATPGKYLAEISVCKSNGDKISLKDAYVRYFASWISALTFGIGYIVAFFNDRKQTLHDIFADTVVIDKVYENEGLWYEWLAQMKILFARKTKNSDF